MDEERQRSFLAPKKLFSKRIRASTESDDWGAYFNSRSFQDSPSSIPYGPYSTFLTDDNGLDESSSSSATTRFLKSVINENGTKLYSKPDLINQTDVIDERTQDCDFFVNLQNNYSNNQVDTSFIKAEPVDFYAYDRPCKDIGLVNGFNTYNNNNSYVPKPDDYTLQPLGSRSEAIDLRTDQSQRPPAADKVSDGSFIKETILKKGSKFIDKFSLQHFKLEEVENSPKHPIPINSVKKDSILAKSLQLDLSDLKVEVMEDPEVNRSGLGNDISLHTLSPVASKSYQNHVSSTNMDSSSDSGLNTTVNDEDLNNLIESEILKNSTYPHDCINVDAVSSSDSKMNHEGSNTTPHKKQGKKWMKGDMVCQVCGDKAAGFYCGAFACEACKKFFMRSCRNDKTKYVCLRDKKCQITAESRVQCQYCRLQKCLSLNMYSPGSDVKKENVGDIPCRVCGAPSSGFHFGALTCEGCKGFFRRMAKERELGKYRCSKAGACEINTSTRNLCKSCRYKKCIDAGMSIEGSRIGRQPNAVKYAISLEVKHQSGIKLESDDHGGFTLEDLSNAINRPEQETPESLLKRPHENEILDNPLPKKILKQPIHVQKPRLDYDETCRWIVECDKELKNVQLPKKQNEKNLLLLTDIAEIWEEIVRPFYYHSSVIIKFAKKCQPFRKLPLEDQVRMLQQALYPIVVLNHSRYYILETKQYSYFGWSVVEREHIWKFFPFYRILGDHFVNTGDNVKLLGLDDDEFTILSTLVLLNPDVPGLTDKEKVRQLQADILDFLEYYLTIHYPDQPSRYGLILVRLSELNFYAFQHLEGIREMLRVYPFLSMPQLYREMFINI